MTEKVQLANTIYRLGHIERILIDRELAPYHLRMNHARVLNYINHHPGSSQIELAHYLDYQQASLTNLINQLERKQMIIRHSDPKNGRLKRLFLLENGKKLVKRTDKIFDNLNDLMKDIDPEVDQFLEEKVDYLRKELSKNNFN